MPQLRKGWGPGGAEGITSQCPESLWGTTLPEHSFNSLQMQGGDVFHRGTAPMAARPVCRALGVTMNPLHFTWKVTDSQRRPTSPSLFHYGVLSNK